MRLGAGLGAGQARVQGARGWSADGRAGRAGVGHGRRRAHDRRAAVALGRAGERHGMGARSAGGLSAGRAGARLRGTVLAGHGRQAARARSLCAQAGPVGCSCTRLGFQPGFSTRYFS